MELTRSEVGAGDTGSRSPAQVHIVAGHADDGDEESTRRRDLLSRRPSYRKILNDLSVPSDKSEANDSESETSSALKAQAVLQAQPSSLHTVTVLPQTIQIAGQTDAQGLQTLTMTNANGATQNQAGATIVQYAQSADGQFFIPVAGNGVQAYQISSTPTLPQGVVMTASGSLGSPQQVGEEASRKRELRLLKNREAARECRRKKKDYVKCLENRVAVLENQNKQLIEELKSLKELYCQKESGVVPDGVTILQTTLQ